jgi:hypothetical protein
LKTPIRRKLVADKKVENILRIFEREDKLNNVKVDDKPKNLEKDDLLTLSRRMEIVEDKPIAVKKEKPTETPTEDKLTKLKKTQEENPRTGERCSSGR